jgi:hypothetical protein
MPSPGGGSSMQHGERVASKSSFATAFHGRRESAPQFGAVARSAGSGSTVLMVSGSPSGSNSGDGSTAEASRFHRAHGERVAVGIELWERLHGRSESFPPCSW